MLSSKQPLQCLLLLFSPSFSCSGCLIGRCHLFDCVSAPVRKFFFCHPLSISVKGLRAAARVAKADVTDCYCSNYCFQFTECPCKNVSARVKCSQCCCCGGSKLNTTEGEDVQPVILENSKAKKKSVLRLT